jgi:hypothetical protein
VTCRNAVGERWTKVMPPEFKTVSERIMVRAPSERLEITRAEYEWVEEPCVRQGSLDRAGRFRRPRTADHCAGPGHTDWVIMKDEECTPLRW